MKRLLIILTLLCAGLVAKAQTVIEPSTPLPLTSFWQEFGGDGSVYTLTNLAGNEKYFQLPWGLDFGAGYNILVGKRTAQMDDLLKEYPAMGAEFYVVKYFETGGDALAYVQIGLRGLFDGSPNEATKDWRDLQLRGTGTIAAGLRLKV